MAHYLEVGPLKARVGGAALYSDLTDDDADKTTDPAVEEWVLDLVDDLVNGYAARGGYTVPLVPTDSAPLNSFLLDIANFKLKARRGVPSKADEKLYDDAMAILEAVATGDFVLPSGTAGNTGALSNFGFDSQPQIFNRQTLKVY